MAEIAFTFHWPLAELEGMAVDEIVRWHAQAARINKLMNEAPK